MKQHSDSRHNPSLDEKKSRRAGRRKEAARAEIIEGVGGPPRSKLIAGAFGKEATDVSGGGPESRPVRGKRR